MKQLLWVIPILPFLGALLNGVLLRNRVGKKAVVAVACGSVGLACLTAFAVIGSYMGSAERAAGQAWELVVYNWIPAGSLITDLAGVTNLDVSMGFLLDPLSAVMLFVVTFVGFLIHVYSAGYMAHEEGFQRYFTYLNLFMGAMLMLILGNNYLVMFVGWEGVGLCSYLLIGFYYQKEFPPFAGRKAFITNRIGDFAFVIALFALVAKFGTLDYTKIFSQIAEHSSLVTGEYLLGMTFASFVALCLFVGATGKSAQIPLFVWLPDAMAGPTPVSALIHAATMVTAGVYMVARSNVIYQLTDSISLVVAVVGAATAIFAATIAIAQTDIKKVLAYSTVSQLGYMFLAAGVGAYSVAIFHVATHAFFKALLFLGSGSVIHAMSGEQDMRKMGGLRKKLPVTFWTFVIGTAAIAGVPLLAGFFSKDAILEQTFAGGHPILWGVGLLTAGLTACYMTRAVLMTFLGNFRGTEEQRSHLHESPPSMTVPLMVLAAGSVLIGYLGMPRAWIHKDAWIHRFLSGSMYEIHHAADGATGHGGDHGHHLSAAMEWGLMGLSVAVAGLGILMAWRYYGPGKELTRGQEIADRFPALHKALVNKWYVDEAYDATVIRGTWGSARQLFRFDTGVIDGLVNGTRHFTVDFLATTSQLFDKYVVDSLVNATGWILSIGSRLLRKVQTGFVSQYAFVFVLGLFALVCLLLFLR